METTGKLENGSFLSLITFIIKFAQMYFVKKRTSLLKLMSFLIGICLCVLSGCGKRSGKTNELPPKGTSFASANFTDPANGFTGVPTFTVVCPNVYPDGSAWYQTNITPGVNNLYLISTNQAGASVTCYVFMMSFTAGSLTFIPATASTTPINSNSPSYYTVPTNGSATIGTVAPVTPYDDNGATYKLPTGGFVPIIENSPGTLNGYYALFVTTYGIPVSDGSTFVSSSAYQYNGSDGITVMYVTTQATYSTATSTYSIQINYKTSALGALSALKTIEPSSAVSLTTSNVLPPSFSSTNLITGPENTIPFLLQGYTLRYASAAPQRFYSLYQVGVVGSGSGSSGSSGYLFNSTDCLIILADSANLTSPPLETNANGIPTNSWVSGASSTGSTTTWGTATTPSVTATTWLGLSGGGTGGWLSTTAWGTAQTTRTIPTTWEQADAIYKAIVGTSGAGNNYYPYTSQTTNPITGAAYTPSSAATANNHGIYQCVPGTNGVPRLGGNTSSTGTFQAPVLLNWGQTNTAGTGAQTDTLSSPGYYNHRTIILYVNTVSGVSSYAYVMIPQQTN